MNLRVAIYARHSTDKQTTSSKDQIARCNAYCQDAGYEVVLIFSDESITGASVVNRSGVSDLIDAAVGGYFERVIAEDLSRISRDLGDVAHFFRKLRYLDIALETAAEGEINELHIGLKGTMNAIYLKDLADKTRRGMIASVLKGSIPGGRAYGYDLVLRHDERGELIRGLRKINSEQAKIIRWIFEQYANGETLDYICKRLNREGISAPKGGKWITTTLIGQMARKTGLLRQTLYKGVVTFNRLMYRRNPDTGKRQSFIRPAHEWIQVPVPELAILDEHDYDKVEAMIEKRSSLYKQRILLARSCDVKNDKAGEYKNRHSQKKRKSIPGSQKRPRHLLGGKLWCGTCDAQIYTVGQRAYSCKVNKVTGCGHRNLKLHALTPSMAEAIKSLDVSQIKAAIDAFQSTRDVLQGEIDQHNRRLDEARTEIRNVLDALTKRRMTPEITAFLDDKETNIQKIKYKIHQIEKKLSPLLPIDDDQAETVLRAYHAAISPLSDDPDDQNTVYEVVSWFSRFTVTSTPVPGDEKTRAYAMVVDYNWINLLSALRPDKTRPFLSRDPVAKRHA